MPVCTHRDSPTVATPRFRVKPAYTYNATVRSVYDGDTIRADIDVGFYLFANNVPCRLYGIDTPELRGPTYEAGAAAKMALRKKLERVNWQIVIVSHGLGKYGRSICTLFTPDGDDINQQLVDEGYAVEYMR